jgi:hypothetical protein
MAVDVESLGRPEHEVGEEVGPRDEGDEQSEQEDARVLLQSRWEHGEFGPVDLPEPKCHEENGTEDQRGEDMS